MAQQVWAFLAAERNRGLWWSVQDLTAGQRMPESTVRGQLNRLIRAGKVEARYSRELGRFCFRAPRPFCGHYSDDHHMHDDQR